MVREGNRSLRSGLRIKSASDVENLCTCRESREWGTICAHALAVGLAYIERKTAEVRARETKAPAIYRRRYLGAQICGTRSRRRNSAQAAFHSSAELRIVLGEAADHDRDGSRSEREARDAGHAFGRCDLRVRHFRSDGNRWPEPIEPGRGTPGGHAHVFARRISALPSRPSRSSSSELRQICGRRNFAASSPSQSSS